LLTKELELRISIINKFNNKSWPGLFVYWCLELNQLKKKIRNYLVFMRITYPCYDPPSHTHKHRRVRMQREREEKKKGGKGSEMKSREERVEFILIFVKFGNK